MKLSKRLTGLLSVKFLGLVLAIIFFIIPFVHTFEGLTPQGHYMLAIFLMAVALWVSEAIPLHATAALIIFLNILMISDRGMLPITDESFSAPAFARFFATLANPILMLFLGGFFLADGAAKYKLDRNLAKTLLKPFGSKPSNIILGIMLIVAIFSMFMSNTATTAAFMAVVLPVIARLPAGDRGRVALALCVPIAANIGGMGTPVGTPPNAIALGALQALDTPISISFIQWMGLMLPFVILLMLATWQILIRVFPSSVDAISIEIDSSYDKSPQAILFYIVAGFTILLWFTEPLHGIPSSIIGFLPVVVMLSTRLVSDREFHSMQWSVLWLVAGGIALGVGVSATGLDKWMIGLIDWSNMGVAVIGGALCVSALVFSTIISNSATANLLVPIAMTLSVALGDAMNRSTAAIYVAIGASLAMMLPISTPPNAIAYATGQVRTSQMALMGAIIGIIGVTLFTMVAPMVWDFLNMLPQTPPPVAAP
jgi:solute carrier family 13 (sodium-dependent dicarboxylate transporter), member 2/3/5